MADKPVNVYTDGACPSNGREGAQAGIGVYWGPDHPLNVSESLGGRPTNIRAEIGAATRALEQAHDAGYKNVVVNTDSKFLIDGATKWTDNWKDNGWKLYGGGDVKNRADFEALDRAQSKKHVRGHSGNPGNEAANRLATQGARRRN